MQYDKRNLKRLDIFLIVEFKPVKNMADSAIGITRDLSTEGFSMEAQSFDCKCGEMLEFRLKHPDTDLTVAVSGKVVWKNHSWYKYMIGVKFPEISEDQYEKIRQLMSVVKEAVYGPELISKDIAGIPVKEKEEVMAGNSASVKNHSPFSDAAVISSKGGPLKETAYSELTDLERNFIAGDSVFEETGPAEHIEQAEETREESPAVVRFSPVKINNNGPLAAQRVFENSIDPAEKGRKKKVWLYAPVLTIAVVILLIALPVVIKTFKNSGESPKAPVEGAVLNGAIDKQQASGISPETPKVNEKEKTALKNVPMRESILSAEIENLQKDKPGLGNKNLRKTEAAESIRELPGSETELKKNKAQNITPVEVPKSPWNELIARKEENLRSVQTMESKNLQEVKPITLPSITPKTDKVVQPEPLPVNKEISAGTSKEIEKIPGPSQAQPSGLPEKNEKMLKAGPITNAEEHKEPVPVVKADIASSIVKNTPATEQPVKSEERPGVKLEVKSNKPVTLPAEEKETQKARSGVKAQEVPKVALFVKRDKLQANQNTSRKNGNAAANIESSRKWKFIGHANSGISMFIDTGSISYPAEHIVNVLIKVTYNGKEFTDLVSINCSQVKLRIFEARNGKHPALEAYSEEWRAVMPESMVLHNSVCSLKK